MKIHGAEGDLVIGVEPSDIDFMAKWGICYGLSGLDKLALVCLKSASRPVRHPQPLITLESDIILSMPKGGLDIPVRFGYQELFSYKGRYQDVIDRHFAKHGGVVLQMVDNKMTEEE